MIWKCISLQKLNKGKRFGRNISNESTPGGKRNEVLNHLKDVPRRQQWTPRIKFRSVMSFIHPFKEGNVEEPNLCKPNFTFDSHSPTQINNFVSFNR